MPRRNRSLLPISLVCLLGTTLVAPTAIADVVTSFTIHETQDGPATTTIASCSFFVKAVGLITDTGTIRIFQDQGQNPPIEVASATWLGVRNLDGMVDATVGPITVGPGLGNLFAITDYGTNDLWNLVSETFQVECPESSLPARTCEASSFLPPLGTPGHDKGGVGQRFKFGQTIPVKLGLSCPGGEPYVGPKIFVAKQTGDVLGAEQPGMTKSSGYSENLLRKNGNHWQYGLDTSKMSKGLWRIRVDVGDGGDLIAWVDLR